MDQYVVLEKAVLNCFIVNPDLMKQTKLGAKHFKKYHNLFNVFVELYKRFETIDVSLLQSVCKNPEKVVDYIAEVIDTGSVASRYKIYEKRLLQLYLEYNGVEEIHKLSRKLFSREIDLKTFKAQLDELYGGEM